jgi:hypothetical protein
MRGKVERLNLERAILLRVISPRRLEGLCVSDRR